MSMLPHPVSPRHTLILSFNLRLVVASDSSLQVFRLKLCMHFLFLPFVLHDRPPHSHYLTTLKIHVYTSRHFENVMTIKSEVKLNLCIVSHKHASFRNSIEHCQNRPKVSVPQTVFSGSLPVSALTCVSKQIGILQLGPILC